MTVCIAALCEDGKEVVLASDQMTTAHFPIGYEFENDEVEKIVSIRDGIFVLVAGDVLFAHEVIEKAKFQLEDAKQVKVSKATEEIRKAYQDVRLTQVIQAQIESRGMDLTTYYASQQSLNPGLVQMIDQALVSHDPTVVFLIAGKEKSGSHIYSVHNPGVAFCHDPIGFAAVGSGGPHATYSMIENDYKKSKSLEEVKVIVEKAKQRSEVAPGVGEATTMVP